MSASCKIQNAGVPCTAVESIHLVHILWDGALLRRNIPTETCLLDIIVQCLDSVSCVVLQSERAVWLKAQKGRFSLVVEFGTSGP